MSIRAVLFDCDGILVDSEHLANEVMVDYVREFGLRLSLDEAVAKFTGARMADCVAELERLLGRALPPDFVPTFRDRSENAFRLRLRPIEGVEDVLRGLDVPCAVVSSGPREKIELTLEITGLRSYFSERIFSAYDVGAWKPDPKLFLHAAHTLGVPAADCAVVEDSLPGVEGGLAAGMSVFAYRPDRPVPGEACVFHRMSALARLLRHQPRDDQTRGPGD